MSDSGKKVAVVLADQYEDVEFTSPVDALAGAGAQVTVIGLKTGTVKGKKGDAQEITSTFADVRPDEFDLLLIPGGGSPENLRIDDEAVAFTKAFAESGKPVAAICHGAQLLISADVIRDKEITCVAKIRDDVKNAGARYVDQPLVQDANFITSRIPDDLPAFNDALVAAISDDSGN